MTHEIYSRSLFIKEMQTTATKRDQFTLTRLALVTTRDQKINNGNYMGKQECFTLLVGI